MAFVHAGGGEARAQVATKGDRELLARGGGDGVSGLDGREQARRAVDCMVEIMEMDIREEERDGACRVRVRVSICRVWGDEREGRDLYARGYGFYWAWFLGQAKMETKEKEK